MLRVVRQVVSIFDLKVICFHCKPLKFIVPNIKAISDRFFSKFDLDL